MVTVCRCLFDHQATHAHEPRLRPPQQPTTHWLKNCAIQIHDEAQRKRKLGDDEQSEQSSQSSQKRQQNIIANQTGSAKPRRRAVPEQPDLDTLISENERATKSGDGALGGGDRREGLRSGEAEGEHDSAGADGAVELWSDAESWSLATDEVV